LFYDYDKDDIRRDITCVPYYWDGGVKVNETQASGGYQVPNKLSQWYFGKLRYEWMSRVVTSTNDDGVNWQVMRLADVYLMAAEAIRAIPHGEIEAARAYGFSGFTLYRSIIIPSALRRALPAYSNEVILMLHATSLAFTATVPDILKIARDVNAATYKSFHAFGLAAAIYLTISFLLVAVFRLAEKRWLKHLKPQSAH
jgi:ABC-type molybdate transport system permease subunit